METHNRGINTAHSNAGNNKKKTQIERRKMWLNIRFHFQKRYSWGANIYGKQKIEGDQNKISHTKMNKIMMNKLRIFSILFQTYQKDKSKIEKSERHCSQTCTDLMNTGRTIFILRTSFRRPSVCVCVCFGAMPIVIIVYMLFALCLSVQRIRVYSNVRVCGGICVVLQTVRTPRQTTELLVTIHRNSSLRINVGFLSNDSCVVY